MICIDVQFIHRSRSFETLVSVKRTRVSSFAYRRLDMGLVVKMCRTMGFLQRELESITRSENLLEFSGSPCKTNVRGILNKTLFNVQK